MLPTMFVIKLAVTCLQREKVKIKMGVINDPLGHSHSPKVAIVISN